MRSGIEIRNPDSTIQISDEYSNLRVASKQVFKQGVVGNGIYTTTVDAPIAYPFMAIYCANANVGLMYTQVVSASTIRYTLFVIADISQSTVIEYYFFDKTVAGGALGIQVWDALGNMSYNSSNIYADIVDNITSPNPIALVGNHFYKPGKQYAVIYGAQVGEREITWGEAGGNLVTRAEFHFGLGSKSISGGVNMAWETYFDFSQTIPGSVRPNETYKMEATQVLVVDITRARAHL
ncbi:hypothetical protein GNF76_00860 [Pseudomonas sp. CCM 7893]|uniref:Uncharacterized protein n=1 Tax=Pseudomonas spelaei TaxID=1055469 RepID=A0A6I3W5P8_9PSED|nr:hypothetical protein [Pseudomonas spelaei]MUF02863.1 hypothetical protein [Pseudomonas spelaei]